MLTQIQLLIRALDSSNNRECVLRRRRIFDLFGHLDLPRGVIPALRRKRFGRQQLH